MMLNVEFLFVTENEVRKHACLNAGEENFWLGQGVSPQFWPIMLFFWPLPHVFEWGHLQISTRTVNMVHTKHSPPLPFFGWISLDFSRLSLLFSRWIFLDFSGLPYQFRSASTSRMALSWLILHIPTFFIPFKSLPDQHSVHFQVLANFFLRLSCLKKLNNCDLFT